MCTKTRKTSLNQWWWGVRTYRHEHLTSIVVDPMPIMVVLDMTCIFTDSYACFPEGTESAQL